MTLHHSQLSMGVFDDETVVVCSTSMTSDEKLIVTRYSLANGEEISRAILKYIPTAMAKVTLGGKACLALSYQVVYRLFA